jgi:hypothetical protein
LIEELVASRATLLGVELTMIAATSVADRLDIAFADLFTADPERARVTSTLELAGHPSLAEALTAITMAVVTESPLLCVHAAVVSGRDGLIAFPGMSGLGKSTLAAALTRAGYGYVSDEALAIDRLSEMVTPFPRPLALTAHAWPLMELTGPPPPDGAEELVDPAQLGRLGDGGRLAHIVLASRRPGAATLEPAGPAAVVKELLARSFNHYRDPQASFAVAVRLARTARIWRAGYSEAPDLTVLLSSRLPPPSEWA